MMKFVCVLALVAYVSAASHEGGHSHDDESLNDVVSSIGSIPNGGAAISQAIIDCYGESSLPDLDDQSFDAACQAAMEAGEALVKTSCSPSATDAPTSPAATSTDAPSGSSGSSGSGSSGDEPEDRQRRAGHEAEDEDLFGQEFINTCKASTSCQDIFTDGTAKEAVEEIINKCQAGTTAFCAAGEKAVSCILDQADAIKGLLTGDDLTDFTTGVTDLEDAKNMLASDSPFCNTQDTTVGELIVALKQCGLTSSELDLPEVSPEYYEQLKEQLEKEYAEKCEGDNASNANSQECQDLKSQIDALGDVITETSPPGSASALTAGFAALVAVAAYFV